MNDVEAWVRLFERIHQVSNSTDDTIPKANQAFDAMKKKVTAEQPNTKQMNKENES